MGASCSRSEHPHRRSRGLSFGSLLAPAAPVRPQHSQLQQLQQPQQPQQPQPAASARSRHKLRMSDRRKQPQEASRLRPPPCFRLRRHADERELAEAVKPRGRPRSNSPDGHTSPDHKPRRASAPDVGAFLPSAVVRDYAAVSTQNSHFRKHMEDECVAIPRYRALARDPAASAFFGVYDGHGGGFCAKYAAKFFHQRLSERLQRCHRLSTARANAKAATAAAAAEDSNRSDLTSTSSMDGSEDEADVLSDAEIAQCYAEAFAALDAELADFEEAADCGTTAVTCLIRQHGGRTRMHVANVGDSRAVLFAQGRTWRLTEEHKATNAAEAARIRALDGIIVNKRVGGSVAVTRALGQVDEKRFITSAPHVASRELRPVDADADAFLLLVSDGVTDVFSDDELTQFVGERLARGEKCCNIGTELLREAKTQGALDNMTAVIVNFGA